MSEPKFTAYGIFSRKDTESGFSDLLSTSASIQDLRDIIDGKTEAPTRRGSEEAKPDKTITDLESDIAKGIWHFYTQLKSYYELANVLDIIPQIFSSSFFRNVFQTHAEKNFHELETREGVKIFGMNDVDLSYVNRNLDRWNEIDKGFEKLPTSILLSLVATYDSAFSEFAKLLLKSRPERYTGSDRQYSVSEILKLNSLDDVIDLVSNDEIDQLMRKSHEEQIVFFEKNFNISVKNSYPRWPDYIEIFERRNLAAHGNLVVNDIYLKNCQSAGATGGPRLGDLLQIDGAYIERSVDLLVEFGVLLSLSAWQKQYPANIQESFGSVVEVSYSLLKDKRPQVACRVCEYGLSVKGKGANEEQVKMMTVNLAIAYKDHGAEQSARDLLEKTDWSASMPKFRLCAASVREDEEAACALLEAAKVGDGISIFEIREWPAFKWMRRNERFRAACEEVFGEPLIPLNQRSHGEQTLASQEEPAGKLVSESPPPDDGVLKE